MMRIIKKFSVGTAWCLLAACSTTPPEASNRYYPPAIADPLEPVNRSIWEFNEVFLESVMRPSAHAYHAVVPEPARDSVGNFRTNIGYPGRLVNELLQGRFADAGSETLRFVSNSTLGVGGLFDVASDMNIPSSNADFAQTFQKWGWQESTYLVLPFLGPSDDVRLTGRVLDSAASPWPYVDYGTAIGIGLSFDEVSYRVDGQVLLTRVQPDPYAIGRLIHTYVSKDGMPDFTMHGPIHEPTYQTLGVATVKNDDMKFYRRARKGKVRLSTTKPELPFSLWLQEKPSPMVYVAPGLGSHRLSGVPLKLAEMLYQQGFSVVTVSGMFHPEFMEHGMTVFHPGDPDQDRDDLLVALTEIDRHLATKHRGMLTSRALVGFSNGAFHTLKMAAEEDERLTNTMTFDRYLAINPPVDLEHGYQVLDEYLRTPANWEKEGRRARIENMFAKAAVLVNRPELVGDKYPFDGDESKYLVGFSFRMILQDALYSIHQREPIESLAELSTTWNRNELKQRLFAISFEEYFKNHVRPNAAAGIDERITLRPLAGSLSQNRRVRAITNRNDFLLQPGDVAWLRGALGSRLAVFPEGGHLGNIGTEEMREAIGQALRGLR